MKPNNLAARAGRWSAAHRKTAVIGWIAFVVIATLIGGRVGQKNLEASASGNGDSKRGAVIVDDAGYPQQVGERVLIQGKGSIRSDDPRVTAAVKDVVGRLGQIKGVTDIESPLHAGQRANTVSKDGRSVLVTFSMPGKTETKEDLKQLETLADAPLAPSPLSRRRIASCASRSRARPRRRRHSLPRRPRMKRSPSRSRSPAR